jgi:hypothetical protein
MPRQRYVCIVRCVRLNSAAAVAGESIAAYRLELAKRPANNREWRELIAQLARRTGTRLAPASAGGHAVFRRIAAMRAALIDQTALLHQGSLFDSRTELAAAMRRQRAAALHAAFSRTAGAVSSPAAAVRYEVVAIWPERWR